MSRSVHWLNSEGNVACNPKDKEATHKSQHRKLFTSTNIKKIDCKKCKKLFYLNRKIQKGALV